jgi:hypothetical protein
MEITMAADFGLEAFKRSAMGRRVGPVLMDPENVRDMMALCRHDIAAVRAVGKQLLALGLRPKDETEKKHIGRWVRHILGTAGWEPVRSGKLPRGNLFSTGAIYKPRFKP